MKLYDLMKMSDSDYDTYDTDYDACITVCYIDEDNVSDNYDKFCVKMMKMVDVEKIIPDSHLVVNWTKLIRNNMEKFKSFTKENWWDDCQYEDDEDEFIYQWIEEINKYMAGYVSESVYKKLNDFANTLE